MSKKLNGYVKWIGITLAVLTILGILGGVLWNAATLQNDVAHIAKNIEKIEQRLEKIEQRQFERGK